MGSSNSKPESESETINWNNIKTDNISSTLHDINGLSREAKQLIASLNIPDITESPTSEFTINHILNTINTGLNKNDKILFNNIFDEISDQTDTLMKNNESTFIQKKSNDTDDLSATSPFISSEMYEYLVNGNNLDKKQSGGGKIKSKYAKSNKPTLTKKSVASKINNIGGKLDDDSSTSSTSDISDDDDDDDETDEDKEKNVNKNNKDNKEKKDDKKYANKYDKSHKNKQTNVLSTSEDLSDSNNLSYLSSSAHTGGEFSDSDDVKKALDTESSESVESSSDTTTSDDKSVADENNNMLSTSISVNTDDINMVSDY